MQIEREQSIVVTKHPSLEIMVADRRAGGHKEGVTRAHVLSLPESSRNSTLAPAMLLR